MKKLLVCMMLMSSISAFACSCDDTFERVINFEKENIAASFLDVDEEQVSSVEVVHIKERNSFGEGALKVILAPLILTMDECSRDCTRYVKVAGKATLSIQYENNEGLLCKKDIKVKGRIRGNGELKMRKTYYSLGESCQ